MARSRRLAFILLMLVCVRAQAHALRLSTGDVAVEGRKVRDVLQFARAELDTLRPEDVAGTIQISVDGAPCSLTGSSVSPAQEDGVAITATWDCTRAPGRLRMELG